MSKKNESIKSQHGSNLKRIAPMKLFTPSQALISWDTAPITTPGKTSRFVKIHQVEVLNQKRFGDWNVEDANEYKENHRDKIEDSKIQLELAVSVRGGHSKGRYIIYMSVSVCRVWDTQVHYTIKSSKRTHVTSNWTAQLFVLALWSWRIWIHYKR